GVWLYAEHDDPAGTDHFGRYDRRRFDRGAREHLATYAGRENSSECRHRRDERNWLCGDCHVVIDCGGFCAGGVHGWHRWAILLRVRSDGDVCRDHLHADRAVSFADVVLESVETRQHQWT